MKGPRTLAGKAQALGLQPCADLILKNGNAVNFRIDSPPEAWKALKTENAIKESVMYIMADEIAKNPAIRVAAQDA